MLVREVLPEKPFFTIKGPITGEKPIYLYLSQQKDYLVYAEDLKALMNSSKVSKPLELWEEGISFLLQSGVVPTPYTIIKNLFVLSIGDEVVIEREGDSKLELKFSHKYHYFHSYRYKEKSADPQFFLGLLKEAILKRLLEGREIFLFHSAGKDSNLIALALAESEIKDRVICITLKGPEGKDESLIAKELAKKMGLRHIIFSLPDKITFRHIDFLRSYFQEMIIPCTDGVSLVYPFYAMEFDFKGKNLIEGSGVDVFVGHLPRKVEFERQKLFTKFQFLRALAEVFPTGNPLRKITLTRAEWIGLDGFTLRDAKKFCARVKSVFPYWKEEEKKRRDWDYLDLKGDLWATHVEYGNVMRKVRILAEFSEANLIFPYTDEKVAKYLAELPEKESFDRKRWVNKIFFRKILWEKLQYEADKIRKFSYPVDFFTLLEKMEDFIKEEIFSCQLWEKKGIEQIYFKLRRKMTLSNTSKSKEALKLILRTFLISAWYNNSKYLIR